MFGEGEVGEGLNVRLCVHGNVWHFLMRGPEGQGSEPCAYEPDTALEHE